MFSQWGKECDPGDPWDHQEESGDSEKNENSGFDRDALHDVVVHLIVSLLSVSGLSRLVNTTLYDIG